MPVTTLIVTEAGATVRAGAAPTVSATLTVWGLPAIATPPFVAASVIEPLYVPAARAADVIVTVKVVLPPELSVADAGVAASQPVPLLITTVDVSAIAPVHAPVAPIVNVWVAGLLPASPVNVSCVAEGACNKHGGCTVSVTATV